MSRRRRSGWNELLRRQAEDERQVPDPLENWDQTLSVLTQFVNADEHELDDLRQAERSQAEQEAREVVTRLESDFRAGALQALSQQELEPLVEEEVVHRHARRRRRRSGRWEEVKEDLHRALHLLISMWRKPPPA
jgi:hypothetical protein